MQKRKLLFVPNKALTILLGHNKSSAENVSFQEEKNGRYF